MTSVVIPPNVTKIDDSAFAYCENMESVSIPAGVNTIGEWAFRNCSALKEVYYGGDAAQWSAISIAEHNDPLLDAQLRENSYYYEPSTPVTPPDQPEQPDEDKGFIFERDKLSFLNNAAYFGRELRDDKDVWSSFLSLIDVITNKYTYKISDDKYEQLTRNLSERAKKFLDKKQQAKWEGSCYGMSVVTMLNYLEPSRIPLSYVDASAENLSDLNYPVRDANVKDFVNYYQLMQYLPSFFDYSADCLARYQSDIQGEINGIVQALRDGKVVLAGTYNHAFLLTGIASEDDDTYTIEVNDPNW